MTGDVARPPVPQAALDAATSVIEDYLGEPWSTDNARELAEAAVSAAFAAVVPADLFIAGDTEVGGVALFREGPGGPVWIREESAFPPQVWALLVALIPTREEA